MTLDGTPKSVSRGQILRRTWGQGNLVFSVHLTTNNWIGKNTRLIHTLLKLLTIHTYIHVLSIFIVPFLLLSTGTHYSLLGLCHHIDQLPSLLGHTQF